MRWLIVGASLLVVACGGYLNSGPAPAVHAPVAKAQPDGRWPLKIEISGDETQDVSVALDWILRDNKSIERVSQGGLATIRLSGVQNRDVGYCSWRLEVDARRPDGTELVRDVKEYEKGAIWSNVEGECEKMITQSIVWALETATERLSHDVGAGDTAPISPAGAPAPQTPPELVARRSKSRRTESVAVVIGIENYRRDLPAASGAADDARLFADHAETSLGIPRSNIHLLVDSDATKSSIDAEVGEWLRRNATAKGDVFFYFAGHGAPDTRSGASYLVPWDADPKFIATQGVSVTALQKQLQALSTRHVYAFVDACFSGAGGRSVLPQGTRPLVRVKVAQPKGNKLQMFTASGADEVTGASETGNGLFSYYLLRGLNGDADASRDGSVTMSELVRYTTKHVANDARRQNRDQTPALLGGQGADDLPLVRR
ncbi:MAG: caspase domain-containing protein [Polyangiaceae bacterium]